MLSINKNRLRDGGYCKLCGSACRSHASDCPGQLIDNMKFRIEYHLDRGGYEFDEDGSILGETIDEAIDEIVDRLRDLRASSDGLPRNPFRWGLSISMEVTPVNSFDIISEVERRVLDGGEPESGSGSEEEQDSDSY